MSTVAVTPQRVLEAGLTAVYTGSLSSGNTYTIQNDGKTILHCKKSGAGSCTVTAVTPNTVDGLAIADQTGTVPATTGDVFFGPFPPAVYNDSTGAMSVTFSETTGLTIAALQVGA